MKKLLFIFALTFTHFFNVNAQKEKLDFLFEKYQEAEGVTSIKIAKPMFSMLNKLNINDSELDQIKPLLKKINGLRLLIVEKPEDAIGNDKQNSAHLSQLQNLQKDIAASIKNMKYEELITVHSKNNKIKFLSADASSGNLENLLLNISAEGNTILMLLDGKISMDDLNNLINEVDKQAPKGTENTVSSSDTGIQRNVGKFTGVSVANGIKVNFTQGNKQSIIIDTDPGMEQYIATVVENDILKIYIKNNGRKNLNFRKLLVRVEGPRLASVDISSGSSFMTVNTVKEQDFKASISSGSNLSAEVNANNSAEVQISSGADAKLTINSKNFSMDASSGSMISFVGKTDNAVFNLSSAANCNAQNFVAKSVTVSATSGSSAKVNATEALITKVSSGASVRYKGNPKNVAQTTQTSSGGSVKPLD